MHDVLVGYDGSVSARQAVAFAVDLARRYAATLHVLVVARAPDWGALAHERTELVEHEVRHCEGILAEIKSNLPPSAGSVKFELVVGQPAKEIVLYAERHDIDHLVVGHRGHTMFDRWLIGSVARQVIAYAPCAVTIVRDRTETIRSRAKAKSHPESEDTPLV
jgi:nucleotide-binding universal stress UspA family protein